MYGYTLQDWVTIRGGTTITSITQSEPDWLGLAPYEDVVFWLDVREVNNGGATNVTVLFETAPTKDEALFTPMVAGTAYIATPSLTIVKVLLAQNPLCPVARWVRWRLQMNGTAATAWDMTFRVLCAANAVGMGS